MRQLGPLVVLDPGNGLPRDPAVQEQDRGRGLVLGRGGAMAIPREMGQEGRDLRLAHVLGVPLAVEHDVAAAPMAVRLLGAEGEVTSADFVLKLIQELGLQEG